MPTFIPNPGYELIRRGLDDLLTPGFPGQTAIQKINFEFTAYFLDFEIVAQTRI